MDKERLRWEDVFQNCLDKVLSGQESLESVLSSHPDLAEKLRPELEAALWLSSVHTSLDPRPAFVTSSCRRLVVERFQPRDRRRLSQVPTFIQRFFSDSKRMGIAGLTGSLAGNDPLNFGNVITVTAQKTIPEIPLSCKTLSKMQLTFP
jgi:hypothetical protein